MDLYSPIHLLQCLEVLQTICKVWSPKILQIVSAPWLDATEKKAFVYSSPVPYVC